MQVLNHLQDFGCGTLFRRDRRMPIHTHELPVFGDDGTAEQVRRKLRFEM
jgi:hypothetical protein